MQLKEKAKILDKETIDKSLKRMAHEIIENAKAMDDTVLIGIKNRGAYIAQRLADKIKEIASLPSKEALLARVVGGIKAPITGFVMVLGGVIRKFVYVMDAVKNKKAPAQ